VSEDRIFQWCDLLVFPQRHLERGEQSLIDVLITYTFVIAASVDLCRIDSIWIDVLQMLESIFPWNFATINPINGSFVVSPN